MAVTSLNEVIVDSSALNERLLAQLKDAVGRTMSARSLSEKLGHSHNYVRRIFSREIPLQVSTLLEMLTQLGMPPRSFFDQVLEGLPAIDPVAVLRFYRQGNGLPLDPFLDEVGPRVRALVDRPVDTDAAVESWRGELDQLEKLRFEDRDGTKLRLESIIREILAQVDSLEERVPSQHLADLALAGATWATIMRTKGLHDNCCDMYILALGPGIRSDDAWVLGSTLQRASYLLRDLDAAEAGLKFLTVAQDLFTQKGDLLKLGQVLLDRGILLSHLGKEFAAFRLFDASLRLLPQSATQLRAAAFSEMAFNCQERDELARAHEYICEARKLYRPGSTDHVYAHILATEARIARKLGFHAEAETAFKTAISAYDRGGNPGYVAFVALDLAGLYLEQGRTLELASLADDMFGVLKILRSNRMMDAVLMEFIRTAKWGELTEKFLADAKERLEGAAHWHQKKAS
ncbi:MAG: hypothetical protein MPN21_10210 [Thermoanaerobaculia bacterium]|nr:hypothetical protein [Thermoanaerobaculia bacterium]